MGAPSLDPTARGEIRGASFLALLRALHELYGPHAARTALRVLPPHLSELAAGQIRRGAWYPLADYAELHRAAARVVGTGPALAEAIGRQTAAASLVGTARFILPEPATLVRELGSILAGQLRGLVWTAHLPAANAAEITVLGLSENDLSLQHELAGMLAALLERCGATGVEVSVHPPAAGSSAQLVARWR